MISHQSENLDPGAALPAYAEKLLQESFVRAPSGFDDQVIRLIAANKPINKPSFVVAAKRFGSWLVMGLSGALAGAEIVAFIFSFWAANTAL